MGGLWSTLDKQWDPGARVMEQCCNFDASFFSLFCSRRASFQADVKCLSFSTDSSLLALTSDKMTVHIFKTIDPDRKSAGTDGEEG